MSKTAAKEILWWGRFDPEYSRNRILRRILSNAGYTLTDFIPRSSWLGGLESLFTRLGSPDCIWVPAFRHRDMKSALRFARKNKLPLIFDPLISSWDKVVFERKKFPEHNWRSRKLLKWEKELFSSPDLVLADTSLHAEFFMTTLGAHPDRTVVIPVGAEEEYFSPQPFDNNNKGKEILFYGSFINLQGPEVIVEAAKEVPEVNWTLLGDGPLKSVCEKQAANHRNIHFEPWVHYEHLPRRIGQAGILLGIFGSSPKASRVIPNKAYQAIACGRPLITRESPAYPKELVNNDNSGITFIPAGSPRELAQAVKESLRSAESLEHRGNLARKTYETFFSEKAIADVLINSLSRLGL